MTGNTVPLKAAQASQLRGLHFFWHLDLADGTSRSQFDPDGTEHPIGVPVWKKPTLDPYPGTMVFEGVKKASLVPSFAGGQQYSVDISENQKLVLYRKTYVGTGGFNYVAFVLGVREERDGNPIEDVFHICPGVRMPPRWKGDAVVFNGGITRSTDPLHKNAYDEFEASSSYGSPEVVPD